MQNREGVLHAQQGNLPEAIKAFEQARNADPVDDTALTNLSCAHNNQGVLLCRDRRYSEAIPEFERAKAIKPEDLQIRFNLLSALVMMRDAERIDREARGIMALRPRDPETLIKLANAFSRVEDDESAKNLLEKILEVDPGYSPAMVNLGRLLYQQGNFREAKFYLDRALEISPGQASATDLLRRLNREERIESGFERESSVHFTLYFNAEFSREWVRETLDLLEEAYSRVGDLLNCYPSQRSQAIVYSLDDFHQVSTLPGWAGGLYDGKIRLPIPRSIKRPDQLRGAAQHEYCHHLVHLLTGGTCPTWLNEGLAQYAEGLDLQKAKDILSESKTAHWYPLQSLDGPFAHTKKRETAEVLYAESLLAVHWLIEERGWTTIQDLLGALAKKVPLTEAMNRTVGFSCEGLDERLRKSLE